VQRIVIMAKAPRPGLAKTRLARAPQIGADGAAQLARAFVLDTVATCGELSDVVTCVAYAPPDARAEFAALAPQCELVEQAVGDLGARLSAAFEQAFRAGAASVVALGTDTPHVGAERLRAAFERLADADVVLGPAADGGYWLIGLRAPRPELFVGIAWSTPSVLASTLRHAERAQLRVTLLDELADIDEAPELFELARGAALAPRLCPATSAALQALRLI
jgi:rSAM/selenodomain-associated transferase 1